MAATQGKSPTRADVARLAGVSTAVVSYVVNDGPRPVSAETKARVLWAIEQLNYRPDARARAFKLGTTNTYGLIVPDVTNTYHAAVVGAIDRALANEGCSLLLAHSRGDRERERRAIHDMIAHGAEGIIDLMSVIPDQEWLADPQPIPIVLMDRQAPLHGHATLGPDFFTGGQQATSHLIEHGYTEILPIHGPLSKTAPNLRLDGYRDALLSRGLNALPAFTTEWSRRGGYRAGEYFASLETRPQAVFCFSDMLGLGFISAVQEAGLHIPDDVAVVCFDGTAAAKYSFPALTAVAQPLSQMCEAAVAAMMGPVPVGDFHQVFATHLVPGATCCAPNPSRLD